VLIDGVDELPEPQRRLTRDWLAMLVKTYPLARYVITSRPGAASGEWLDGEGFAAAEVQPMSWSDVREFVRHWHAAFRADSADSDRHGQLKASEVTLLDSLYARRHLRLIATSPLLCALLCALNLDRRTQLPDERMELYATALEMLLERRDVERLIAAIGPQLSKTVKKLLLEDIAFWLIRSGWSDAPRERVAERISRKLAALPRSGTGDGAAVLDALVVRSGLIREPVAGRIDFIHRTFEEYLAASAAASEDQIGELVRNAHDDQWREVVVMAAGHAQPRQREELLRGLLSRADQEPETQQTLQVLVVACLETAPQLDPKLHTEIQEVAESLLPPQEIHQAEILARIGEPLLDLLAERPVRDVSQATATIRAASLVGGDAALSIIAACGRVPGLAVKDELMRAWPFFDAEEYARVTLAGSPNFEYFTVTSPGQLPGLRHITGLRSLGIQYMGEGYGNLAFIGDLPNLKMLNIMSDPALRDLSPLAGHPVLGAVLVKSGSGVDLRPPATLAWLRSVHFSCHCVTNVESLRNCARLESIGLNGLQGIGDVSRSIPDHPLKQFELSNGSLPGLASLAKIPGLARLDGLNLIDCECPSLRGIEHWAPTLRRLQLWGLTDLIDLTPLTDLPGLQSLSLIYGTPQDLRVVRGMSSLRDLYLWDKRPIDITPLRGMRWLTVHIDSRQEVHGAELGEGSKLVRG
jgi:hypothetical protein